MGKYVLYGIFGKLFLYFPFKEPDIFLTVLKQFFFSEGLSKSFFEYFSTHFLSRCWPDQLQRNVSLFVCLLIGISFVNWEQRVIKKWRKWTSEAQKKKCHAYKKNQKKKPQSAGEQNLKLVKHSSNGKRNLAKIREDLRECISPFIWYMSYLPHQKWSQRKRGCQ